MIRRPEIQKIVNGYDDLRIAVLGSHSALEIMDGAKDEGLDTIVFCQKGRETPYQRFDRIADEIKILKKFSEMSSTKNQKMLRDTNTIIVPHRALTAYLGYNVIENSLKVPIFGNRALFQAEERNNKKNQNDQKHQSAATFGTPEKSVLPQAGFSNPPHRGFKNLAN